MSECTRIFGEAEPYIESWLKAIEAGHDDVPGQLPTVDLSFAWPPEDLVSIPVAQHPLTIDFTLPVSVDITHDVVYRSSLAEVVEHIFDMNRSGDGQLKLEAEELRRLRSISDALKALAERIDREIGGAAVNT